MVSLTSKVNRNPNQIFSRVDQDIVMLSLDEGKYFALNEVGARIWEYLEHSIMVKDLINKLLYEFDVSIKKCEIETMEILNDLYNNKLIVILTENDQKNNI